ncbi:MAG TPA: right-handed parallel beta-helix repeat-containing protein, partial [Gaiellaceae bacterium]|nr:right-handed parallel beta-helix repeat-containing protein [Gaiellaceae bacterium]
GRAETRVAALLPVLLAACVLAGVLNRWWPVELVALMAAVGLFLDLEVWHRLLPYQPAWATVPLGAVELGMVLAVVYGFGLHAPLLPALALFGAGWLALFVLAQAGFPLLRLGYAEDGGELGRVGGVAGVAVLLALAGSAATYVVRLPPVVQLSAGVHQGPLVITRREVLQGAPGAVVRGGIVVAHDDVQIKNVTVVGGENGITVDGVHGTVLDGVTVQGAKLDGIHVRLAGVVIRNCTVDMLGNRLGQGIDISFNMNLGMSMVEGCTVVGGQQGITTHSSGTEIMGNRVSRTTGQAISVDEMSMGMASRNTVRDALGVALYCGDRSMCMFDHNTVIGTRPDTSSGLRNRRGFGVFADFESQADLWRNTLTANPVATGAITGATLAKTSRPDW